MFPALEEIQLHDEMEVLINATPGNHTVIKTYQINILSIHTLHRVVSHT